MLGHVRTVVVDDLGLMLSISSPIGTASTCVANARPIAIDGLSSMHRAVREVSESTRLARCSCASDPDFAVASASSAAPSSPEIAVSKFRSATHSSRHSSAVWLRPAMIPAWLSLPRLRAYAVRYRCTGSSPSRTALSSADHTSARDSGSAIRDTEVIAVSVDASSRRTRA